MKLELCKFSDDAIVVDLDDEGAIHFPDGILLAPPYGCITAEGATRQRTTYIVQDQGDDRPLSRNHMAVTAQFIFDGETDAVMCTSLIVHVPRVLWRVVPAGFKMGERIYNSKCTINHTGDCREYLILDDRVQALVDYYRQTGDDGVFQLMVFYWRHLFVPEMVKVAG